MKTTLKLHHTHPFSPLVEGRKFSYFSRGKIDTNFQQALYVPNLYKIVDCDVYWENKPDGKL